MAEMAVRQNGAGRSLFGDVLGFDPFRGIFPGGASSGYGFEITRAESGYKVELPVPASNRTKST